MSRKRIALLVLLLCMVLLLCGCRTRTSGVGQGSPLSEASEGLADTSRQGESVSADSGSEKENADIKNDEEPGNQTKENPDSPRKEYDENAPAEIFPGTDRLLHEPGEGSGAGVTNEEADHTADRLNDEAEEPATQTVAAQEAEQMGVSDDAEAADSALTYFTVLLQARMGSLFECQRQNVYWETARDHVTIHKTAPEHALILNAGCYDVSARLLPENLLVDDGWVVRKNPGVIVKLVDSGVLGSGVNNNAAAKTICQGLINREGWPAIDAVKNGRVLLLSQELLDAPYLQTAAMVMLAKASNPSLFSDVDAERMLSMLTEEATGALPTGIYYYCKEE